MDLIIKGSTGWQDEVLCYLLMKGSNRVRKSPTRPTFALFDFTRTGGNTVQRQRPALDRKEEA